VATVARLLPRDWDGRRLLQFLTGLALIALAFALPVLLSPAAPPADSPVTVITTVDTPLAPGLPLAEIPAPPRDTTDNAGPTLSADTAAGTATRTDGTDGAAQGDAAVDQGEGHSTLAGLPLQDRQSGRILAEARAALAGATQSAHSERGPPRA
jgi:hypothetical protein